MIRSPCNKDGGSGMSVEYLSQKPTDSAEDSAFVVSRADPPVALSANDDASWLAPASCSDVRIFASTNPSNGDITYTMSHGFCNNDGGSGVNVEYLAQAPAESTEDSAFVVLTRAEANDPEKAQPADTESHATQAGALAVPNMFAFFKRGDNLGTSWASRVGSFTATANNAQVSAGSNGVTTFSGGHYSTGFTVGDLRGSKGYTVAAYVKYTGPKLRMYSAIVGGKGGSTEFFIGKGHNTNCLGVQDNEYHACVQSDSNAFDGQYHSVIFSEDANGDGKMYVDGVHVGSAVFSGGAGVDEEQVLIGEEVENSGYTWQGEMKSVAFFNAAIDTDTIADVHSALITDADMGASSGLNPPPSTTTTATYSLHNAHEPCPADATENITEDECRYVVAGQLERQGDVGWQHPHNDGSKCFTKRITATATTEKRVCKSGGDPNPFCTGFFCEDFENGKFSYGGGKKNGPAPKDRWSFIGGHVDHRIEAPTIISGAECHGGKGNCLQFSGCTAYGDTFSKFDGADINNCHNGDKPQISFWYSGGDVFAGSSAQIPDAKGHGHAHSWIVTGTEATSGAIGNEWKEIKFAPTINQPHLMFETWAADVGSPNCNSLIDDIQVTCIPQ
jgi:hypothetical protein